MGFCVHRGPPPAPCPPPRPKTRKKHLAPTAHELYKDPAQQAAQAGLHYATDAAPGYARKAGRSGEFSYHDA